MSLFVKLMIASWTTAIAVIGFCALHQSGNLLKIRKRMAVVARNLGSSSQHSRRKPGIRGGDMA